MPRPDLETKAILKDLAAVKPLSQGDPDVSVVRAAYDEVFANWTAPTLKRTQERWVGLDSDASDDACLVIEPADNSAGDQTLVFIHGGGWSLGSALCYAPLGRWLCAELGVRVLVPDFPQAPEAPAPAARLSLEKLLIWAASAFAKPVILMGDSAGGNLAAVLANHLPEGVEIAAQALLYPVLDLRPDADYPSRKKFGRGKHFLTNDGIIGAAVQYCGETASPDSPLISPILETEFSTTPPAVILIPELDPLRDECVAYAERLAQNGVKVETIIAKGAIHGCASFNGRSESGRSALQKTCNRLKAFCAG